MKFTNRLAKESSPYLLQHAHNPVDWFPWGEEALEKAKLEDKPILISIGYSTCHWCHVMEHESFENEQVAAFMNKHFVNIKLDREERPDLDQIYMETCQIITGSGGWPLNCFLLPDGRPYYAGTYFPPVSKHGRPSWIQVLQNMHRAFTNQRDVVEDQANKLIGYFDEEKSEVPLMKIDMDAPELIIKDELETIFYKYRERFDTVEGGFGNAPKFPSTHDMNFLLDYGQLANNEEAQGHALFSIKAMCLGGIYDHLKGGFSRYTVDREWMIPHFEKMIYDNALLLPLLGRAHLELNDPIFHQTALKTVEWLKDEMQKHGLFNAALDADSEGVEGKFYVWSWKELSTILNDAELKMTSLYFNAEPYGNWEENNILHRKHSLKAVVEKLKITEKDGEALLQSLTAKLLNVRAKRIRPSMDTKQIMSWNCLMIIGLLNASRTFDNEDFKRIGLVTLEKVKTVFVNADNQTIYRLHQNGEVQQNGFLDDYSFYIQAQLCAYQIDWDLARLKEAKKWLEIVNKKFGDKTDPFFYFADVVQKDLVVRKKEKYDGALPSANAMICKSLKLLGVYFGEKKWMDRAELMLRSLKNQVLQYPNSFGNWARLLIDEHYNKGEIAIVGPAAKGTYENLKLVIPQGFLIMVAEEGNQNFPLLYNKGEKGKTLIYLCKDFTCHQPVTSVDEAKQLINKF